MKPQGDIAVIGLAVMGQNLIMNLNDHGFKVVAFNRTVSKVDDFLNTLAKGAPVVGAHSLEEMVAHLRKPRLIMLMVKAGQAVDDLIAGLIPYLEKGDVIIDGGNSHFSDTDRRVHELAKNGIFYIGMGISGGQEGARHGPSIMPGGNSGAWPLIREIYKSISAETTGGERCCDWVGPGGSGHFVKMIHNGIEYGDMQLICEAYHVMRDGLGIKAVEMSEIFSAWNKTELESYLIEITARIMNKKDDDGCLLIDKVLDRAGQKGTGQWTSINALESGVPLTLITESVFARFVSARKEERVAASQLMKRPHVHMGGNSQEWLEHIRKALLAAKVISYAQGFMAIQIASNEYRWDLDPGNIALLWRAGCIIRSGFLDKIKTAFHDNPDLDILFKDEYFKGVLEDCLDSWRRVVAKAVEIGIPAPSLCSGLTFYDSYTTENLPANLLQAQRDFFGAHTYERKDRPRGTFYHSDWNEN